MCFLLLTPLALISAYLCLVGATMALERSASAEATGLVLLALFLALVYVVWIFVTVRYVCQKTRMYVGAWLQGGIL